MGWTRLSGLETLEMIDQIPPFAPSTAQIPSLRTRDCVYAFVSSVRRQELGSESVDYHLVHTDFPETPIEVLGQKTVLSLEMQSGASFSGKVMRDKDTFDTVTADYVARFYDELKLSIDNFFKHILWDFLDSQPVVSVCVRIAKRSERVELGRIQEIYIEESSCIADFKEQMGNQLRALGIKSESFSLISAGGMLPFHQVEFHAGSAIYKNPDILTDPKISEWFEAVIRSI